MTFKLVIGAAVVALLSACASNPPPAPQTAKVVTPKAKPAPAQRARKAPRRSLLSMKKGLYRCELNRNVRVKKISPDKALAVLTWKRRNYTMRAVTARSGALRYEHKKSGLTWITVVGKSMLLDTKKGRQLANECRT